VFPYILKAIDVLVEKAKTAGVPILVLDAPTLFESGADSRCDYVLVVVAEKFMRVTRVLLRDKISYDDAIARMDSQLDERFFRERADFIIDNTGDLDSLMDKLNNILAEIKLG